MIRRVHIHETEVGLRYRRGRFELLLEPGGHWLLGPGLRVEGWMRDGGCCWSHRATSGPTPFSYRYAFSAANAETVVQIDAVVELNGATALLSPLVARSVKRGVDHNFAELKRILEMPVGPV